MSGNNQSNSVAKSELISLAAADYVEVMYAVSDTGLFLDATAATAFAPTSPAVLISITQVQQ